MISNQVLQNTLEGLREISRTEFCIIDTDGKTLASTYSEFEIQPQDIQAFVESQAASQLVKGYQYFKVCDDYQLEYILVAHGEDEDTYMVGKLAAFQIQSLIVAYKERFDKDSFIKNLLLDNLLLVDIYNRAKKLHIDADVRRVVMILELEQERVALARAIVNRPDILLADEPTGNLDPKTSEEIMKLLEEINQRGTTVLVVTHNKEIVNSMKKRVLTMHNGVIISDEKEGEYYEA